jgi:uncharacterized protein (DUF488 family)
MTNASDPDSAAGPRLLSVGHSNHSADAFLDLLRQAGVTAVADVRSAPHSRRLPHFNGPQLAALLRGAGITYVFLGDLLGGRPAAPALYDDEGRVDYERVRGEDFFRRGLDRLVAEVDRFLVAMMCSEEDPLDCHRGLMITPALREGGLSPGHLRRDGSVETTDAMERRLLEVTKKFYPLLSQEEQAEALADAYRHMARRKAYRRGAAPADEDD